MARHAGDVHEAAAGLDEGEEGLSGFEGTVVVALEGFFDDMGVCDGKWFVSLLLRL